MPPRNRRSTSQMLRNMKLAEATKKREIQERENLCGLTEKEVFESLGSYSDIVAEELSDNEHLKCVKYRRIGKALLDGMLGKYVTPTKYYVTYLNGRVVSVTLDMEDWNKFKEKLDRDMN